MVLFLGRFKRLFIIFITGILCILYFFFQNKSLSVPINEKNYYYEVKNNHSHHIHIPISKIIKIIPLPKFFKAERSILPLSAGFSIVSNQKATKDLQLAILRYSKYVSLLAGFSINIDQNSPPPQNALTIDCPSILSKDNEYPKLGEDESYILNITKTGSYLQALSLTGIIRGLSTFIQLIERNTSTEKTFVPFVHIADEPRFTWRGLMLDVSRHWMPVSVIEKTLNAMELSKLNVLHLHLSDDQGFRVESLKHPLLHDRKDFFTQKDIQHLVEYARQRRIRIIPEFDIPGHTTSWFVGYPELATELGPYQVETKWGVMKPTMNPIKNRTYTFLDVFFREMTELFPDPYFHIGGDEVEGSQWNQSRSIRKFIEKHRLKNKNGLQAYFNKRIQAMLKKYNKTMIGWEEIRDKISDNLAIDKDAVIQSWKSRRSLFHAIKKGYRGLLSNGYYLDHLLSSIKHYKVDPISALQLRSLNKKQRTRILGGEACMWSEYVSENNVDSRIWPRTLAIAERFWSPSATINHNFLYERLFRMNHLVSNMQIGLTHLSLYKSRLQNLIIDPDKKMNLLHPFMILADVCEPSGLTERSQTNKYTSTVPLTTFTDALQSESELVWKLQNLPIDDEKFRNIFHTWSVNHLRLNRLFDEFEKNKNRQLWGQDIEQLSKNLAHIGEIGLRILDYKTKKVLHYDKSNHMNSWTLSHWISHHNIELNQLEIGVKEIRLAAVRPVRRLLDSIKPTE